jgi:cyclic pyranopterin phosphate synthase
MGVFSDHQPTYVEIETTTYCNRRCVYCPNSAFDRGLKRNKVMMPTELFRKIVEDLGRNNYCNQFSPHRYGEPLSDPRMPELLQMAREAMPLAWIKLYTNGDFLSPALFHAIDPYVDAYTITQHGPRASKLLKQTLEEIGFPHPKISYGTAAGILRNASNRGGLIEVEHVQRKACGIVMTQLSINAHGDVALCCEDYLGERVFGNMADQTVEDVWTQEERLQVHRGNMIGQFALPKCASCGYGPVKALRKQGDNATTVA